MSKNKRKTRYIVYVSGWDMDKPDILFDAAYTHLVRKGYPIKDRKQFMAEFVKAVTVEDKMGVVDAWVQVRDIATFPMQQGKSRGLKNTPADSDTEQMDELITPGKEQDEDTEAEGGVPMDDGADEELESGSTSK